MRAVIVFQVACDCDEGYLKVSFEYCVTRIRKEIARWEQK
ncbi:hypothetical protein EIKCOROL_01024 [Eikenella corrodens ATCC 23834]|uniref:Uncharacterized protein n=1 Tax=Eikenella corrodens ATCC 23834 TaxID=546274 RepID=C0DUJ2_EIKCO|nr:hypothetical protein EIKCOROL_01024 [Eikenella corrodens ATCC 23834]